MMSWFKRWRMVPVVVVAIVASVAVTIAVAMPAHVPLVQSVITAGATVILGWQVLQFQKESQSNALAIEYYKPKSKALASMARIVVQLKKPFEVPFGIVDSDIDRVEQLREELTDLLDAEGLWLPEELIGEAWRYRSLFYKATHEYKESMTGCVDSKTMIDIEIQCNSIVNKCRRLAHSDELSEATLAILKHRVKDKKPVERGQNAE